VTRPPFAPRSLRSSAGLRAYERVARLAAQLVAENGGWACVRVRTPVDLRRSSALHPCAHCPQERRARCCTPVSPVRTTRSCHNWPKRIPKVNCSSVCRDAARIPDRRLRTSIDHRSCVNGRCLRGVGCCEPLWSPPVEEWRAPRSSLARGRSTGSAREICCCAAAWPEPRSPKARCAARLYLPDETNVHVLAAAPLTGLPKHYHDAETPRIFPVARLGPKKACTGGSRYAICTGSGWPSQR